MADPHRLTERAHLAVLLARQEAAGLGASSVTSAHLVLGLLLEDEGTAARVLESRGLRPDAVRASIGPAGPSSGAGEQPPLSPTSERILARAVQEARWLGAEHAATEHVLLGVLHEADGDAIRLLLDAGVAEDALRDDLLRRRRKRR